MIDRIESLIRKKKNCVLATSTDDKPHCSLMTYIVDENCREIYLITHKRTRKYSNLQKNNYVSLLLDTRDSSDDPIQALTIGGIYIPIEDPVKRKRILDQFLSAHPSMKQFADHVEAELICIKIDSFLLLNGLTDTYFFEISS